MKTRPRKERVHKTAASAKVVTKARHRYLELVRQNPLRVIRSEGEYERAIAILDRLSDRGNDRTADETEYLLALSVFIERYEGIHHPIPAATGVDMLRYLIEAHRMTQAQAAAGSGLTDSTISEILAGKRRLSVKHIDSLARFFKVKPAVFLDE
jgi:HTH-type transcriptional regulator / antitoxin HigA